MEMTRQKLIALILSGSALWLSACSNDSAFGPDLSLGPDNGAEISDGGAFDPASDGDVTPCVRDEDGVCEDEEENSGGVSLGVQTVAFGLGEEGFVECETIELPGGMSYSAEIDAGGDAEEFAFLTGTDAYTQERVEGGGEVSVCYLRSELGSHSARMELVLDAEGEGSPYAYVVTLTGSTLATFFTITSPADGEVVDGREGHNAGRDDDEGDYLLNARGSINMELVSVLEDGIVTPIIITSAGVKYRAELDESGAFATTIGVPQTPGIYEISFSAETSEDSEITREINVVVADAPEFGITIKDLNGNDVAARTPSDAQGLVAGFKVSNLELSGPDASAMPVLISGITWNDVPIGKDMTVWFGDSDSWCGQDGDYPATLGRNDFAGFDGSLTYCFRLDDAVTIESGQNVLQATASNALGSASDSFTLILDYDKPSITIAAPRENELLDADTTSVTLSGTVKNYAPNEGSAPAAIEGDTGAYCLPSSSEDDSCPDAGVTLWINQNPEKTAVNVYPEVAGEYAGKTTSEIFADLKEKSPERCREIEVETTDATGATETTTETRCNIPEGKFSFILDFPHAATGSVLNLYKNVIELRAESLEAAGSHRTIAVRTFAVGETHRHHFTSTSSGGSGIVQLNATGSMSTGQLGELNDVTGLIENAPVMLNLSEGILKDPNLKRVAEKILNDNLPFENMANGWNAWPEEDDGEVDVEADFQRQYKEAEGENYDDFWQDLPEKYQEKFIRQGLHNSSMAMKYWALVRYVGYGIMQGWWDVDDAYLNFFERQGDPEEDFNVALDSCDQVITTSFVPIGDLYRVYEHMDYNPDLIPYLPEWPDIAAGDYKFNDFVSGRWIVQSLSYREGTGETGSIDADICLVPDNAEVDNCEDDIPDEKGLLPAFWGHIVAYNLVEGGLLGPTTGGFEIDDPTMPLIWSIGKIRLKLTDVIKVKKTLVNGEWTNKVYIDEDGITPENLDDSKIRIETVFDGDGGETLHDKATMARNSIQIYPYSRCEEYYRARLADDTYLDMGEREMPFGCDEDYPDWNYPVVLERNTELGRDLYNTIFGEGQSYYILGVVWQGVMETFAKMIRCMDEEQINPLLNETAFPYPAWIPESDRLDTDFALDTKDGELKVVSADEAESPAAELSLNLAQTDLNINHPDDPSSASALTLRLPFTLGVDGVTRSLLIAKSPAVLPFGATASSTAETANTSGYLTRGLGGDELEDYPLADSDPEEDLFLSASLGIEEIVNAVAYLAFKKGPFSYLDDFGVTELELNDDWSIGVDKVVLARFGICDNIAESLSTDLPPGILFANIESEFDYPATHLDITLDKNHPPSLAMTPIADLEDSKLATDIKLSLTNVTLSVKELENTDQTNAFRIGREVVRLRLDGILSLKAVYHAEEMQLNVFIEPYAEQNLHFSVVPGHGGASYDEVNVVYTLATEIIPNVFNLIGKTFDADYTGADGVTVTPSFSVKLKADENGYISLRTLDEAEIAVNAEEKNNGACEDGNVPVYASDSAVPLALKLSPAIAGKASFSPSSPTLSYPNVSLRTGITALADSCDAPAPVGEEEDALKEALCEVGIKDIELKPTIAFDNGTGYLHLSAEWALEIYDWLIEETGGQ